jgi:hypothetical protein
METGSVSSTQAVPAASDAPPAAVDSARPVTSGRFVLVPGGRKPAPDEKEMQPQSGGPRINRLVFSKTRLADSDDSYTVRMALLPSSRGGSMSARSRPEPVRHFVPAVEQLPVLQPPRALTSRKRPRTTARSFPDIGHHNARSRTETLQAKLLEGLRLKERTHDTQIEIRGSVRYEVKDPDALFRALRQLSEVSMHRGCHQG